MVIVTIETLDDQFFPEMNHKLNIFPHFGGNDSFSSPHKHQHPKEFEPLTTLLPCHESTTRYC